MQMHWYLKWKCYSIIGGLRQGIIESGNRLCNYLQIKIEECLSSRENTQINYSDNNNLVNQASDNDGVLIENDNND